MLCGTVHIRHPSRQERDGGISSARESGASQSALWASVEGTAGIDRSDSCSQERSHVARDSCEETSGAIARDFAERGDVGCQVVRDLFEVCAFRIVSRPRRLHNEMLRVCLDDHETLLIPQIGRQDDGQTVHDRRGTSMCAIPVRVVHTGGDRL